MRVAPPPKGKIRSLAVLTADRLNRFIEKHGVRVRFEPAAECPCQTGADRDRQLMGCPICNGLRFEYPEALQVETRAIISDLSKSRGTQSRPGVVDSGQVRVTVRGEYAPGERDRFVLLDAFLRVQSLRTRSATGTDRPRHPIIVPDGLVIGPEATDMATSGVLHVRVMDADTGEGGAVVEEGLDFEVVDGTVDWTLGDALGTAPAPGTGRYSMLYFARPAYVVENAPHAIRIRTVRFKTPEPRRDIMPAQVFARLEQRLSEVP